MLILLSIKGPDEGRVIALAEHQFHTLGCGDVTLRLADKSVLSRHAEMWHDQDGWRIRDIDSSHGTYINDKRITEPTNLAEGDRIQVGKTILVLASVPHDLITDRSSDSSQQWAKVVQGFLGSQQPQLDSLTHRIVERLSMPSRAEHGKLLAASSEKKDDLSGLRDIGHKTHDLFDTAPLDHELDQQITSAFRSNARDTATKFSELENQLRADEVSNDEDVEQLKEAICSILTQLRPLLDQVLHRLDHPQFSNELWINAMREAAETPSLQVLQLLKEMFDWIKSESLSEIIVNRIQHLIAKEQLKHRDLLQQVLDNLTDLTAPEPLVESVRKSIAPDLVAMRKTLDDLSRRLESGPSAEQWTQAVGDIVRRHLDSLDSSIRERLTQVKASDILARQQTRPEPQVADLARPDTSLLPIVQAMPLSNQTTSKPISHTNFLVAIVRKTAPTVVVVAAGVIVILSVLNFFWRSFKSDDTLVARGRLATSIDGGDEARSALVDLAVGSMSATDAGGQQSISPGLSPSVFDSSISADSMKQIDLTPDQSNDPGRLTRLKKDYQRAMETGQPVIVGAGQINPATGELSQGRLLDPRAARKDGITNWQDWYQLDDLKERHHLQRLVEIYTGGQSTESDSVTRDFSLDR